MVDLKLKRGDFIGNNYFRYFSFITQLPCFILEMILCCEKENPAFVIGRFEKLQMTICISNCRFAFLCKYSFSIVPMPVGLAYHYILTILLNKKSLTILEKNNKDWVKVRLYIFNS